MPKVLPVLVAAIACFGLFAAVPPTHGESGVNLAVRRLDRRLAELALEEKIEKFVVWGKLTKAAAVAQHWTIAKYNRKELQFYGVPLEKRFVAVSDEMSIRGKIERKLLALGFYRRKHISIEVSICKLSKPFQHLKAGTIFASCAWPVPAKLAHGYWSKPVQCYLIRRETRIEAKAILSIILEERPRPQVIVLLPCHWVIPIYCVKVNPYLFAGYNRKSAERAVSPASPARVAFRLSSYLRIYHYWTKSGVEYFYPTLYGGTIDDKSHLKYTRHSLWHGFERTFVTHVGRLQKLFWKSAYRAAKKTGDRESFTWEDEKQAEESGLLKNGRF